MIVAFKDILEAITEDIGVLLLFGNHGIFNNMVIDKFKENMKGNILNYESLRKDDEDDEFSFVSSSNRDKNTLEINEFFENCHVPSLFGKWYCRTSLKGLNKKQTDKLSSYMKQPSPYAKLVIDIEEYKTYREYCRMNVIKNNKKIILCSTSYPSKKLLSEYITNTLKGVQVSQDALDLFISRMGDDYDSYPSILEEIKAIKVTKITEDDMKTYLRGIDNYGFNEFIDLILRAGNSKQIRKQRLYSAYYSLISEYDARYILQRIETRIDRLLEYRVLVNKGYIPAHVRYSVKSVKEKIGDEHRLSQVNDISFRIDANKSTQTSIKDLWFIKMIISKAKDGETDFSYTKALIVIMYRKSLNIEQLMSNIGIKATSPLYELNRTFIDAGM